MNAVGRLCISAAVLLCCAAGFSISAEENNVQQRVILFSAGSPVPDVPRHIAESIDEQLLASFTQCEGLDIKQLDYRLKNEDINRFTMALREARAKKNDGEGIEQPIHINTETIAVDDFNQILDSYIVVIPVLTEYTESAGEEGIHTITVVPEITVIRVHDTRTMVRFSIRAEGTGEEKRTAVEGAAEKMRLLVDEKIAQIPLFQVREGIITISGPKKVVISFGKENGIKQGDLFGILNKEGEEAGMMVVERVERNLSFTTVLYSQKELQIGDRVVEKEYIGGDTTPYLHAVFGFDEVPFKGLVLGFRQGFSSGFFLIRPFFGLEFPFLFALSPIPFPFGFHVHLFAGGEMNWYAGRFLVSPRIAAGAGLSTAQEYGGLTHAGFLTDVTVSYLISNRVRLFAEGGYTYWFGFGDAAGYGGWTAGLGLTIHY